MKLHLAGPIACLLMLTPAWARGAIQSAVSPAGAGSVTSYVTPEGRPGRLLSVAPSSTAPVTWVVAATAGEHIGELSVRNASSQPVHITADAPAIDAIRIADQFADANHGFVIIASLDVGQLGAVRVNRLQGATVHDDALGPIELLTVNGDPAKWGNLTSLVVMGDLLGDVYVEKGNIDALTVRGRIGAPETPVHVLVDHAIKLIRAGEINANFARALDNDWAVNFIHRIEVTTTWGGSGDLRGRLRTYRLAPLGADPGVIRVEGGVHADILIGLSLLESGGSPPMAGRLELADMGLHGQVVIGARASQPAAWTGPVLLGGSAVPPAYPEPPEALGGGAVGLVPFQRHEVQSWPPTGAVFSSPDAAPGPASPIRLGHYGRVTWDPAQGDPILFERLRCDAAAWDLIDPDDFTLGLIDDGRTLVITPLEPLPSGEYRVTPITIETPGFARLMNQIEPGVVRGPVALQPVAFTIEGAPPGGQACPGDLNADGAVDAIDLNILLDQFGDAAPPGALEGDANADGVVDSADLNILLVAFSVACDPCDDPGGPIGGPGDDPHDPPNDPDPPKDPGDDPPGGDPIGGAVVSPGPGERRVRGDTGRHPAPIDAPAPPATDPSRP